MALNATSVEPQELTLLGSMGKNCSCVEFGNVYSVLACLNRTRQQNLEINYGYFQNISPKAPEYHQCVPNQTQKIGYQQNEYLFCPHQFVHEVNNPSAALWNNDTAKGLPPGIFLICGDAAWQEIQSQVIGGPWFLGKLILFKPSKIDLLNHTVWNFTKSLPQRS